MDRNSSDDTGRTRREVEVDQGALKRDATLNRLRDALQADRLSVEELALANAHTDPYNSGVRDTRRHDVWGSKKRAAR
jgi:hypothetical protein